VGNFDMVSPSAGVRGWRIVSKSHAFATRDLHGMSSNPRKIWMDVVTIREGSEGAEGTASRRPLSTMIRSDKTGSKRLNLRSY
jgi:hypothetical protein